MKYTIIPIFALFCGYSSAQTNLELAENLFTSGLHALGTGDYQTAIADLEKLSKIQPNNPRVKLELARSYEGIGKLDDAKTLYSRVLGMNPPPPVADRIKSRIAEIESVAKKEGESASIDTKDFFDTPTQEPQNKGKLSYGGNAGFFFDSNVNAGPDTNSITIFDLPFVLDDNTKGQSDGGYQASLFASYRYQIDDNWVTNSGVSYNTTNYFDNDSYNYLSVNLNTGVSYTKDNYTAGIGANYSIGYLGGDLYRQAISLNPDFTYRYSKQWVNNTGINYSLNFDNLSEARNGHTTGLNNTLHYYFSGNHFLKLRKFVASESTKVDQLNSFQFGASVGYYKDFSKGYSLYIEPSIRRVKYQGVDSFFGSERSGKLFSLNTNLSKKIERIDADIALGYTYSQNFSNQDLYDYNRHQVSLVFKKTF